MGLRGRIAYKWNMIPFRTELNIVTTQYYPPEFLRWCETRGWDDFTHEDYANWVQHGEPELVPTMDYGNPYAFLRDDDE